MKEIIALFYELRLKFDSVSPNNLVRSANDLINRINDKELASKFKIALESINSTTKISDCQKTLDDLQQTIKSRFSIESKKGTSLINNDLYEISSKIFDLFAALILYFSHIFQNIVILNLIYRMRLK